MKIGFLGAGAMAEAVVKGLLDTGRYSPDNIACSDISESRLNHFRSTYHVSVHKDNKKIVEISNAIVLAVKPDKARGVILEVKDSINKEKMLISVAAGISTGAMESWVDAPIPVVRVMPNTPCTLGKGISAVACGKYCTESDLKTAEDIFASVGETVSVPENLMNAVTGVSGSGPAYIYLVIEALTDAAVTMGLSREVASRLVIKTVIGSAEMVDQSGLHPAVLKTQVVSPGGTTAAGLIQLEEGKLRAVFARAVKAAAERAGEIGE